MTNFSAENLNAGTGGPKGGGMDSRHNVNKIAEMSVQYLVDAASPVPVGFRLTDIGIIPEDWNVLPLRDITILMTNGFVGTAKSHYTDSHNGVIYIQGYNVLENGFDFHGIKKVTPEFHKKNSKSCLRTGDVLMVQTGDVGLVTVVTPELEGSNCHALIINRFKSGYDSRYFAYLLNSNQGRQRLKELETGTTMKHINVGDLLHFEVPFPSLKKEQTAIANALSDVDALISELEKLIAKKQAIKTATMQQLLTGRTRLPQFALREDGTKKGYKQSELGEVPEDWEVDSIGRLISITTGAKNTQDRVEDGAYPFFVRSQTIERINSYSFDGEAVLTAGDGVGTGKIFHYINGKFDFHQRVYLMHNFGEKLDGYYFYIFFSTNFYDRIMSMTAKSSVDSVRREMISDMKILLPSKAEQTAIATILSDMDSDIQTLEQRLNKTRQIKQGMMQELLTGKTRLIQPNQAA